MQEQIRLEVIRYMGKKDNELCKDLTMDTVNTFAWSKAAGQLQQQMPILHGALTAAVTAQKSEHKAKW